MTADVVLVLDFLNTLDVEAGTDVLDTEEGWSGWATARGLAADPLADAVRARDALRAAAGDHDAHGSRFRAPVEAESSADGVALKATTAVAAVLSAAARLTVLGEWDRIKICPADDCRWVFHDRSRNRSRTWCSMRVCGNRQKARSFRQRSTQSTTRTEQSCG
ncbi:CGNR zinc finger domain-containing protein [Saccharomonospora xinjiangensis]|uniref:CGNR zinc finger domain-containing protein n=1 Tax=Saccharomonospora xinjiangensis TaxID=75294 RepID=UPI00107031BC|nr:CGNR zinc finger domain-containing protein [Saccharomonospora xinjiangensis]QBQ58662.1 CGNR zinc finger [Saccharomonospora xinjiangensis]